MILEVFSNLYDSMILISFTTLWLQGFSPAPF